MRANRKEIIDNIFDSYPTLDRMRKEMLVTDEGGKEIQVNLMYGKNAAEAFDGYDPLNTDAVDGITAAFYSRRYYAVPLTISWTEEQENQLPATRMSLLEAKTKQSMLTMRDTINAAIYSAQSGKNMNGLQDIIADSVSAGTLGGIDRSVAANAWWRNYAYTSAKTFTTQSVTNIFDGFTVWDLIMDNVEEGNERVTDIWTTKSIVRAYRTALSSFGYAEVRLNALAGVDGPRVPPYYGADIIADLDCASTHSYFINKKYLKMNILTGANFAKTPFKEGTSQLAKVAFIVVGVQLTTDNPRRLGVGTALTGA